ncbi:hypothetical protein L873DRAFT_63370 [Choiromyces venosus 120613-1]|uniref:Uncharacterized protein n=1 Tax=Choiromyces venosus 120613-1 TaxID=1336337 RepID=A0A3N4J8X3_9PEZI|nr:hypothetical protein L873DRAFT_63370 [Choiromyces venosus 120613-1]
MRRTNKLGNAHGVSYRAQGSSYIRRPLLPSFPPSLLPSFSPISPSEKRTRDVSCPSDIKPPLLLFFPPSLLPFFPSSLLPSFPPSLLPFFSPSLLPSVPPSFCPFVSPSRNRSLCPPRPTNPFFFFFFFYFFFFPKNIRCGMAPPSSQRRSVRKAKHPAVSVLVAASAPPAAPPRASQVRMGKCLAVSSRPATSDVGTPTPPPVSAVRLGKRPAVKALDGQQRSRKRRALRHAVTSGGEAERASRMSQNVTKKQPFEPAVEDSLRAPWTTAA